MAKKKKKNGSSSNKKRRNKKQAADNNPQQRTEVVVDSNNFLPEAGPGCHIARRRRDISDDSDDDWVLDWEDVENVDDYYDCADDDDIPDIALDPTTQIMTFCNIDDDEKVAYITIQNAILTGRHGHVLKPFHCNNNSSHRGTPIIPLQSPPPANNNKNDDNESDGYQDNTAAGAAAACTTTNTTRSTTATLSSESPPSPGIATASTSTTTTTITTLIVLCPPKTFVHLCHYQQNDNSTMDIQSDVQIYNEHPYPNDTHCQTIGFPFSQQHDDSSFLCTQGVGGSLTHFLLGNLHAIDFQCPIGTPIVAVGNGKVVSVQTHNHKSGIDVHLLFHWNSILLELDDNPSDYITPDDVLSQQDCAADTAATTMMAPGPLFVEYVHIDTSSVQVGDIVQKGQIIGTSGNVGFCPQPHLHLACYRSPSDTAPTVRCFMHNSPSLEDDDGHSNNTNNRIFYLPRAGEWYDREHGPIKRTSTAVPPPPSLDDGGTVQKR